MAGKRKLLLLLAPVTLVWFLACSRESAEPLYGSSDTSDSDCYGTSVVQLPEEAPVVTAAVNDAIGGQVVLPERRPTSVTSVRSGLVPSSLKGGRPAFIVQFGAADASQPTVELIYSDRPLCELSPTAPEQRLTVDGVPLFVWTRDVPVAAGARGVFTVQGTFVDIQLTWARAYSPNDREKTSILAEWVRAILGRT
jgi:hypothetical protein